MTSIENQGEGFPSGVGRSLTSEETEELAEVVLQMVEAFEEANEDEISFNDNSLLLSQTSGAVEQLFAGSESVLTKKSMEMLADSADYLMQEEPSVKTNMADAIVLGAVRTSGDKRRGLQTRVQRPNFEAQSVRLSSFDLISNKVIFAYEDQTENSPSVVINGDQQFENYSNLIFATVLYEDNSETQDFRLGDQYP